MGDNGLKKMIAMFTAMFFLITLAKDVSASTIEMIAEDIVVTGERMSLEDYKDLYGGPFEERKSREELLTYQSADLEINAITIINVFYITAVETWEAWLPYLRTAIHSKSCFLKYRQGQNCTI